MSQSGGFQRPSLTEGMPGMEFWVGAIFGVAGVFEALVVAGTVGLCWVGCSAKGLEDDELVEIGTEAEGHSVAGTEGLCGVGDSAKGLGD